MNNDKNEVTYVNTEALKKQGKSSPFKALANSGIASDVKGIASGASVVALSSLACLLKARFILGDKQVDTIVDFINKMEVNHPGLSNYIEKVKNIISVDWSGIQSKIYLCSFLVAGLGALGATAVWGIKKFSLNKEKKKGYIYSNEKDSSLGMVRTANSV